MLFIINGLLHICELFIFILKFSKLLMKNTELTFWDQSGDRRYLYHQGNEQTTWRRSEGGRQALVNIKSAPPAIPFDTIVTGLV